MTPRSHRALLPAVTLLFALVAGAVDAQAQVNQSGMQDFSFSPGDRVRISVWPDSTLGGVFPIEESGVVHLPLLGTVEAAGKTVSELREELREGYSQDLQLPVVGLQAEFRVAVLGAVRQPGVFWVDPTYGIFELISEAGGFLDDAKEDEMVITRASGQSYSLNAERLTQAGSGESVLTLRAGDRLVVPQGGFNWSILLQSLILVAQVINIAQR